MHYQEERPNYGGLVRHVISLLFVKELEELLCSVFLRDDACVDRQLDELELVVGRPARGRRLLLGVHPRLDEARRLPADDVVERIAERAGSRADAPTTLLEPTHHDLAHLLALLIGDDEVAAHRRVAEDLLKGGAESVLLRIELVHGSFLFCQL